jgi:hypothetical protein
MLGVFGHDLKMARERTIDQIKARLAKTIAYLKTLDPIDSSADCDIKFPLGGGSGLIKDADYLNYFVLPNYYYFHLTAAYAILRQRGVEIGKRDFIGSIPMQRA